jgi:hypothetical protein
MSLLQFTFFEDNLIATSEYLVEKSTRFPSKGKTPIQLEAALKDAAIKSFKSKYQRVQTANHRPLETSDIEAEVLETPVLWDGIGALFCPVTSVAVSGAIISTEKLRFPVADGYIVGVTFLATLR